MKLFTRTAIIALALGSSCVFAGETSVCDNLKATITNVTNVYATANAELHIYVQYGNVQGIVITGQQLAQAYLYLVQLKTAFGQNSCMPKTNNTDGCKAALAPAPQANNDYDTIHQAFSYSILSGNIPQALQLL